MFDPEDYGVYLNRNGDRLAEGIRPGESVYGLCTSIYEAEMHPGFFGSLSCALLSEAVHQTR